MGKEGKVKMHFYSVQCTVCLLENEEAASAICCGNCGNFRLGKNYQAILVFSAMQPFFLLHSPTKSAFFEVVEPTG